MTDVFREFLDLNIMRSYPLTDDASGVDLTGYFTLPTSLITDIYLCVPNLPYVDTSKFYIMNIVVRRYYVDITIGYEGLSYPLGTFKSIAVNDNLQVTYSYTPSQLQTNDQWTPLYHMTGQIVIGTAADAAKFLGSWTFTAANTRILPTRIARGCISVQYLSVNGRLFTGMVKLKEGANVKLTLTQKIVGGNIVNVITVSASLTAAAQLEMNSDADVYNQLLSDFGPPILTINGLYPDGNRNFSVVGADCTDVQSLAHGVAIANPCAAPCCDQNAEIQQILTDIANLNLRYAQLKAYFDAQIKATNDIQNKLLVLGAGL